MICLGLVPARALAQDERPVQTWGGKEGIAQPEQPAPPPPPATIGTPIGSSKVEERKMPPAAEAVVHTPRPSVRYVVEAVEVQGNTSTMTKVVLRYVPFKPGDTLDVDDPNLELVRYRLLGTGYFRDVQLALRKGHARGNVVLVVSVVERNTIVINAFDLGVSADVDPSTGKARPLTAFGGIDVSENNLAGTGTMLGGALAVADRQIGLRTRLFVPQILGSDWTIGGEALYNDARDFFGNRDVQVVDPATHQTTMQDFAVVDYKRFGGRLSVGHDLGATTHIAFDYRLEGLDAHLPVAASHRRGLDVEPIDFMILPGTSLVSGLRGTLVHDTRDEPFLTNRGWYLWLSTDGAAHFLGSDYEYFKVQARASRWFRLPWKHVLRLEAYGGAIFGRAPLFERFYVGDFTDLLPDRVLDLAFDRRTAPNFFGSAIGQVRYGDYAARISAEYRVPLYRGQKAIYGADLFGSAGLYTLATPRELTDPARGYTDFAKFPVDFTFNFGVRVDTAIGGVNLGLSTLFGFIPVKGGGP
jgi:outer membrane protein assembly factor BamA